MVLLLTAATGAWAQDPDPISLTSSANGTVWTLTSMPEYNVELEIKYCDYPAATLTAAPTAKTNLLFTGSALPLVDAGTAANGTLYYALGTADAAPTEESDWSTDLPTASAAGVYYVWYLVMGDATHNGIDPAGPLTVTVKANITAADITAPTAVENLKYKGVPQALVVAGSVTGGIGTMYYRLGTDGTWSTDIPTATDKGDYTVYYKVVGDDLHNDYVPAEGIAVTIGEGAEMAAQLTVNGNDGTSCTAMLLDAATYQPLASGVKVGEKFILNIVKEDGYDFNVTGATFEEFTEDEYVEYYNWAKEHDINVSLNAALLWVTMPHVDSGNLNLTVNFQQMLTYTLLYQPASGQNPDVVACKMERSVKGTPEVSYMAMRRGASMGDGTAVWTTTIQAAYGPTKVAFVPVAPGTSEADLTTALNSAAMSGATISQSADSWTTLDGAKYLIIGGNAKVVTAAFVADANAVTTYKDFQVDEATTTGGVTYQLAVCITDGQGNVTTAGTVKAPAAPTAAQGMKFDGWRGYEYDGNGRLVEKVFAAGADVSLRGNMTLNAIWSPQQITTTFALNGGANFDGSKTVDYGQKLNVSGEPTRSGLVFDKWTVAKAVNESGILFGRGSQFDMNTPLTANLELTAQWKHVHQYTYYTISKFGSALAAYQKYNGALHIAICGCDDVEIVAHEFNKAGKCACGYVKPGASPVTLNTLYGQLSGTTYNNFANGFPEDVKQGDEVKVEAPHNWGSLEFKKWQYSTDGSTWHDLAAFEIVGFIIPCNMTVRAIYVNPVTTPTIELATSEGTDQTVYQGQTYKMGNILYQMNYKLPDGYKLLDAGIRMGDNAGISYYFEQTVRYSYDNESKGIIAGMNVGVAGLGVLTGHVDLVGFVEGFVGMEEASFDEAYGIKYLEREDNVMDKMSAATLAKKMYESIPINVKKYDPIYWEAKAPTKGNFGSIATMPPLRFAQKNNQDHYIYGIAYMRYKTPGGVEKVLYTDAIAATVNNPYASTTKTEQANARLMHFADDLVGATTAAAQKAPKREPEQQAELLDKSTITVSQAQLVVYVDGTYSASLSDTYGYGETVSVKAPAVSGKTFSYWTTDDGAVISTDQTLTLTINAHTTLHAVYGGESKTAKPAITSVTRTNDGEKIVIQAIATGTVDAAGIVYSTTATEPTIGADGVTKVEAVKYSNLPTTESQMPASVLDKNNCFSLQITPADETTVYYARAYATVGGSTTYGDVKTVTLGSLKSGMMMIANIDAFIPGIDDELIELKNSGDLIAGYHIDIPAGEFATCYSDKALKLEDGSDMKLYTVVSVSGNTVTLSDPYNAMPENTPMLVYNPTANDENVLLIPCDDPGLNLTVYDGFKGTAEDKALNADGNGPWNFADNTKYYGMDGHDFVRIMTAGPVAANRCWIEMSSASPARQLTIVWGEGTGVKEVNGVKEVYDNSLYDLQGRRVANGQWSMVNGQWSMVNGQLRKGVYILNGKKKVVK